jgi:hypothetical protein
VHVGGLTPGGANLSLDLVPRLIQDIAKNDFGTFTHKELGLRGPLSSCSTADEPDFPIEPAHGCLLSIPNAL